MPPPASRAFFFSGRDHVRARSDSFSLAAAPPPSFIPISERVWITRSLVCANCQPPLTFEDLHSAPGSSSNASLTLRDIPSFRISHAGSLVAQPSVRPTLFFFWPFFFGPSPSLRNPPPLFYQPGFFRRVAQRNWRQGSAGYHPGAKRRRECFGCPQSRNGRCGPSICSPGCRVRWRRSSQEAHHRHGRVGQFPR